MHEGPAGPNHVSLNTVCRGSPAATCRDLTQSLELLEAAPFVLRQRWKRALADDLDSIQDPLRHAQEIPKNSSGRDAHGGGVPLGEIERKAAPGLGRPSGESTSDGRTDYAAPSIFTGVKLTRSPSCSAWSWGTGWRLTRIR